jgi:FeS assembly SUF system protein
MNDKLSLHDNIVGILKTIYDPEIPVNLMDLGLIYAININDKKVTIQMTLTNPGCPVAEDFVKVVNSEIAALPQVNEVVIELVWDPPWTTDRMTEAAKLQLGLL